MVNHDAEVRNKEMTRLHEQVRNHTEKTNVAYKTRANKHRKKLEFSPRDLAI